MKNIEEIYSQFGAIQHVPMNAPHDSDLSELRKSFELDVDSIAGLLSFEFKGNKSPYMKQIFDLPQLFKNKLVEVRKYKASRPDDLDYKAQIEEFLTKLIIVSENLSIYLKEKYS